MAIVETEVQVLEVVGHATPPANWAVVGRDTVTAALFECTDENYVHNSPDSANPLVVEFPDALPPPINTDHFIRVRAMVSGVAAGSTLTAVLRRRSAGATISTKVFDLGSATTWTTFEYEFPEADIAAVSDADYRDWQVTFTTSSTGVVRIAWARLYIPPYSLDYALKRTIAHTNQDSVMRNQTCMVSDPTRNKVYYLYICSNDATTGGDGAISTLSADSAWFREYDVATDTLGDPVKIYDAGATNKIVEPMEIILLDNGTIVALFNRDSGDGASTTAWAYESTDNGLNWDAGTEFGYNSSPYAGGSNYYRLHFAGSDGETIVTACFDLAAAKDMMWVKRNPSDGTWTIVARFDNGTSTTIQFFDSPAPANGCLFVIDSNTWVLCAEYAADFGVAPNTYEIRCWKTTNAGSTTSYVIIDSVAGSSPAWQPRVRGCRSSGGTIFITYPNFAVGTAAGASWPKFAYSTDNGSNWTVVEATAAMKALTWSEDSDGGVIAIGPTTEKLYFYKKYSVTGQIRYGVWQTTNALDVSGWTQIVNLIDPSGITIAANSFTTFSSRSQVNYLWFDPGGNLHIGTCFARNAGTTVSVPAYGGYTNYGFAELFEAEVEPPPPPPPPDVEQPVETGLTDNNMLLRIDLAEGRGWSVHTHPVACFMTWDEGDKETGREVAIILTGSPSVDPSTQEVAILPAIWRIFAEHLYGKRVYFEDTGDVVVTRTDPLKMRVITKEYSIPGDFNYSVFRAVVITYAYDGEEFTPTVEVLIDGKICRVIELENTNNEKVTKFFSLPPASNVGEAVQFVIEDDSTSNLEIDSIGVKYIQKKWRGYA